ncbi:YycC family protein [Gorillibacterium timonense]|uniref:YycC family protein n=1 Tax=Gorillibacterium timonense TaxID=1689269 RepID=UPI00071CC332|nr:YycC family protein [Gorillibacterium timonense]
MQPLKISAETAVTLSKALNIPIEQLMHMPQHILMQKLAQLSQEPSQLKEDKDDDSSAKES